MSNIVGHVLALARFLEENPEQKGYHKGFLNERLRAEVKDLATYQTVMGHLRQQSMWTADDLASFDTSAQGSWSNWEFMRGVGKTQDYSQFLRYFPADVWHKMQNSKGDFELASTLITFLGELGLRLPSEQTSCRITAMMLCLSNEDHSQDTPLLRHGIFKGVKHLCSKILSSLGRPESNPPWVATLPELPSNLDERWFQNAMQGRFPVTSRIQEATLQWEAGRIACRTTNALLKVPAGASEERTKEERAVEALQVVAASKFSNDVLKLRLTCSPKMKTKLAFEPLKAGPDVQADNSGDGNARSSTGLASEQTNELSPQRDINGLKEDEPPRTSGKPQNMVDAAKALKERLALASQKQKAATAAKEKKAKDQDLVLPVTQKPSGPGMKRPAAAASKTALQDAEALAPKASGMKRPAAAASKTALQDAEALAPKASGKKRLAADALKPAPEEAEDPSLKRPAASAQATAASALISSKALPDLCDDEGNVMVASDFRLSQYPHGCGKCRKRAGCTPSCYKSRKQWGKS